MRQPLPYLILFRPQGRDWLILLIRLILTSSHPTTIGTSRRLGLCARGMPLLLGEGGEALRDLVLLEVFQVTVRVLYMRRRQERERPSE